MKFHAYLMKTGEIGTNVNSKDSKSKNNLHMCYKLLNLKLEMSPTSSTINIINHKS